MPRKPYEQRCHFSAIWLCPCAPHYLDKCVHKAQPNVAHSQECPLERVAWTAGRSTSTRDTRWSVHVGKAELVFNGNYPEKSNRTATIIYPTFGTSNSLGRVLAPICRPCYRLPSEIAVRALTVQGCGHHRPIVLKRQTRPTILPLENNPRFMCEKFSGSVEHLAMNEGSS